ncbi:MAG: hypothetical protein KTR29_19735 [Rhodothermaceae bacterium]|nr:hypothetical protein [Rhodothermaceae bacterium]
MDNTSDNISFIRQGDVTHSAASFAGQFAFEYILPFLLNDSTELIANINTEALLLKTSQALFPVTINNEEYSNSYVCSPYTACVSYLQEEIEKLNNKPLEYLLSAISRSLGVLLKKARINKVVSVNNWMLSTNLYPAWDGGGLQEMRQVLEQEFPDHAFMFRSLNRHTNARLIDVFLQNGFMIVPSRQVYVFDQKLSSFIRRTNTKRDMKVLKKTKYEVVDHEYLGQNDYSRMVELYNLLYLEKYSLHNPQLTEQCVAYWHRKKLFTMMGLRNKEGILDGVIGFFEVNGVMSAPLVGYDTSVPRERALYRMLMALALRRANDEGKVLNMSSGAPDFKRVRGGEPFIEYSAVYIHHLSWPRQFVWKLTNFLLTHLGVPIMKAFKL